MKTALFGGSFDPVHNGHVDIISRLSQRFDKVIVMPTAISPFKMAGGSASASDRLNMLKGINFGKNVEISDFEINSGGVSYTANTLKNLKKQGEEDITIVIGSEETPHLDKWRESEYLKNFDFLVIPRPKFTLSERSFGYKISVADFEGKEVSSNMIKVDVAFNKIPDVPKEVLDYIKTNDLYVEYKKYVDAYATFNMKQERIEHTYRAIKEGINLAKIHGAEVNKVILALILHDIGKYVDRQFLTNLGIKVSDVIEELPQALRHAHYSRAIANQYFMISDTEILDAIQNHTTCAENMDVCSSVVALADFIEEGRNFEGIEEVRRLAKTSLPNAILKMLDLTLSCLKDQNAVIGTQSQKAYEFYKNLCENK